MSTLEDERKALEERMAALEAAEREQAEAARQAELAEREANLDPEMRARREEIERQAREELDREFPPAWMPQKHSEHPKEIIGMVLRIDPKVGPSVQFGTYSAVIEVRTTDGREWTIWANEGGALNSQMYRLRLQPGDVVGARYEGERRSANGFDYHNFKLVRVGDSTGAAQIDYDALRATERPALGESTAATGPPDDDIPF